MSIWSNLMSGVKAFRVGYFNSQDEVNWDSFDGRRSRYAIYWAYYDSTAYDRMYSWSNALKSRYSLYKSIRNIASPTATIVAHFRDHIWGGTLNNEAGNVGAIPIFTEDESLRPLIADIWKYSQWSKNKNLLVTKGCVFGDVGLRIVDNVRKKRVYLEIVDPAKVKDVVLDPFGNVRDYTLEYEIDHPDKTSTTVTYKEEVTREGENVVYKTYLNDTPFAYPSNIDRTGTPRARWSEPYGFTPLCFINHIPTGETYGWSEFYYGLSILRELDDQVSLLSDQLRKTIRPIWFITGAKEGDITFPSPSATSQRPEPWRETQNMIYASSSDVSMEAMVAKLDIDGALSHIKQLTDVLEKQYPELVLHRLRTEGQVISGRALRVAQMPSKARVIERRNSYDSALTNALQMAMSIGGWRGYYPGIDLNSYRQGKLDFEISEREVFILDPEDKAEVTQKFFQAAKFAVEAGIPIRGFLESEGKTDEEIDTLLNGEQEEDNDGTENIHSGGTR